MTKKIKNIPVSTGTRLELTVESLASSGDGVYHFEGYTLFIPGYVPGDRLLCEVINATPRFGVCKVVNEIMLSPKRVEPECPYFFECGGCQLQLLSYQDQITYKLDVVKNAIERIGHQKISETIPFIPCDHILKYRNRGIFAVAMLDKSIATGFYKKKSHDIVDIDKCPVLLKPINLLISEIKKILVKFKISVYDEDTHKGFIRKVIIRTASESNESLIGFVTTNGNFDKKIVEEVANLNAIFLGKIFIAGIVQNINNEKSNVILGDRTISLWGKEYLCDHLGDINYKLSLTSFFQVNPFQMIKLNNTVAHMLGSQKNGILDAYCGIGSISLWLGKMGKEIVGVEENRVAIQDAIKSAKENGITTCSFVDATMEAFLSKTRLFFETIILNPPRKGCSWKVIEIILKKNVKKIIYVSCNPASLARDLNILCSAKYKIADIKVIDMFPQTVHMETVVMLESR